MDNEEVKQEVVEIPSDVVVSVEEAEAQGIDTAKVETEAEVSDIPAVVVEAE